MVITYYVKLFRTGADGHNGILISILLLAAETIGISSSINQMVIQWCGSSSSSVIIKSCMIKNTW